jgi:hypothetical protein
LSPTPSTEEEDDNNVLGVSDVLGVELLSVDVEMMDRGRLALLFDWVVGAKFVVDLKSLSNAERGGEEGAVVV